MKQIIKTVALLASVTMLSTGVTSNCLGDGKKEARKVQSHHKEHPQKNDTENDDSGTSKFTPKPSPNPTPPPTPAPSPTPAPAPPPAPAPAPGPDGAALYNSICAACHGNAKMHSPVAAIQAAINSNRGGMGSYSYLTPAQLAAISAY